jgi:hypothetical protein
MNVLGLNGDSVAFNISDSMTLVGYEMEMKKYGEARAFVRPPLS